MCQCVSRWRPAEVDDLVFGCRRRRSFAFGTRSVMESLAAPSVEAMTPTTPLLPPNARRSSLSPRTPTANAYKPHHDVAAAPLPSLRLVPTPLVLPLSLVVTPALERDGKRDGEPRQCRRHRHCAPLMVVLRATLGACMHPPQCIVFTSHVKPKLLYKFSQDRSQLCIAVVLFIL